MIDLVIHWPNFGPYHRARLKACVERFSSYGQQVVGLEIADSSLVYPWERPDTNLPSTDCHTIFPGRVAEKIPWVSIFSQTFKALTSLAPRAVAINGYSAVDSLAILLWCRLHSSRAILMSASKEDDAPRKSVVEFIKRALVSNYHSALCSGEIHGLYLQKLGLSAGKIFYGYDVVDNDYFSSISDTVRANQSLARHLPGLQQSTPFFLASNRFVSRKNLMGLLAAYNEYHASMKRSGRIPWRLILLGDGPQKDSLENFVRESGLVEAVIFPGFRQINEIPYYYALAQAFIHPALQDQWGLVVNEAMACGLPVLVSERAGCAMDLVLPGITGWIFDPEDTKTLTILLIDASTDKKDLLVGMGLAARNHIGNWSPKRFAESLHDAYMWIERKR